MKMTKIYLSTLIIFVHFIITFAQKMVMELQASTLEAYIKTQKMGFLEFYSPNCQHCQSIEPVYEHSAKLAREKGLDVVFSRIDADKHPNVMYQYNIQEVPTILWFNNMHDHLVPYQGDTEMSTYFMDYIEEQMKFDSPQITFKQWVNISQHRNFQGENVMIFAGDKEQFLDQFNRIMNAAWNVEVKNLFWTKDPEFFAYYKLRDYEMDCLIFKIRNNSTMLDRFEKLHLTLRDMENLSEAKYTSTSRHLENIIKLYSKEIVNIFSHNNEKMITAAIPTLVMAHKYETGSLEYDQMIKSMTEVALKYRREIFFMFGSPQSKFTQIFTESYRLFKNEFPVMTMASVSEMSQENIEKYKLILPKDRVPTVEDISTFIEDWKSMKLKPYVGSEQIPSIPVDENGIIKLVGDTFKKTIETIGKDVFLVLCTDKLDTCVKFRDLYSRLARKLRDNEKILFTEINPYVNELDFYEYNSLPGIVLFPDKGNKFEDVIEFKDRLTTKQLVKFIKENVAHPILKEESLPVEEIIYKDEDINELKPINLEQKGMARKLHEKLTDPDQKELYKFPEKETIKKEREYLTNKLDAFLLISNYNKDYTKEDL